jgi:hypothetical protein
VIGLALRQLQLWWALPFALMCSVQVLRALAQSVLTAVDPVVRLKRLRQTLTSASALAGAADTDSATRVLGSQSDLSDASQTSRTKRTTRELAIDKVRSRFFDSTSPDYSRTKHMLVDEDGYAGAERALIARRWNVPDAMQLIADTMEWRRKQGIDRILERAVRAEAVLATRRAMGDGFFGQDLDGYPLYWIKAGLVDLSKLKEDAGLENLVNYHIQLMEYNQKVYYTELSRRRKRTFYSATIVVDLAGFSVRTVGGCFMEVMTAVGAVDGNYYYENMHKVLVMNAPVFFRFFWRTAAGLFHPDTRAKFIVLETSEELMDHVDKNVVPVAFGGAYEGEDAFATAQHPVTAHARAMDAYMAELQAAAAAAAAAAEAVAVAAAAALTRQTDADKRAAAAPKTCMEVLEAFAKLRAAYQNQEAGEFLSEDAQWITPDQSGKGKEAIVKFWHEQDAKLKKFTVKEGPFAAAGEFSASRVVTMSKMGLSGKVRQVFTVKDGKLVMMKAEKV